jgi:LysR family transcriptional regulator, glycine cleavage system transcriptional activator
MEFMPMGRKLPPFAAIRAFEAAARCGSFTEASHQLNVTQSAISHQVKRLEEYLGIQLFERAPRGLNLTPAGQDYLGELTSILDRLDESTRQLCCQDRQDLLRIRATPAFITRWLLPRMHGFQSDFPDLDYEVTIGFPPTDFSQGDVDIYIHWGTSPVAGARVEPFFKTSRSPVASVEFLRNAPEIQRPEDLLSATLLHDKVQDGWSQWFQACGVLPPSRQHGPRFAHCELALQAAETSQGVALAYLALIQTELRSGHLVRLFDEETLPQIIYSLAYQERDASKRKIEVFRDWLLCEVQHTRAPLHVVASGGS